MIAIITTIIVAYIYYRYIHPCCYYHGSNRFGYDEDTSKGNDLAACTDQESGHDDDAWSAMEELRLMQLATSSKTKHLFENPEDSPEFQGLLMRHLPGIRPEQCRIKIKNMNNNLKTTDLCKTSKVLALKVTHWDNASQQVSA